MLYAIKILDKTIQDNLTEIQKIEKIEPELSSDNFFKEEELKERK